MMEETDNFDFIENYIEGNLEEKEEITFLQKLRDDDALYQDFQLWTHLDDWLEEIPGFEIRQALQVEVKGRAIKPIYISTTIKVLAACVIPLLIGLGLNYHEYNKNLPQLAGQFQYAEINAPKSGNGLVEGDNSKPHFYDKPFEVIAFSQKDTTYQFTFEPFMLKFRLPKVYKKFGKNLNIIYDYELGKYTMTLENQTFNIQESKEWKKLYPQTIK